jgi:mRNA-degrading endonuclease RelE of RelBE toxin-antitoxin system
VFKLRTTPEFDKSYKKLRKRYTSIDNDIEDLKEILLKDPKSGDDLGHNLYKVRIKNSDKNKGKSAGYRVITYLIGENGIIDLIFIYDKGDMENVALKDLLEIIRRNFK